MVTEEKGIISRNNQEKQGPTGHNYLLAISIDTYQHAPPLSNCVRDAQALIGVLTTQYNFVTKKENKILVYHLVNKQATRKNILRKLADLKKKITPNDNLLLYFSGHGETADNTGFWIPVEAHPDEEDEYISTDEIKRKLNVINSFHTLLIVDACFSGALFASYKNVKKGYEHNPSRWGLAASHSREVALDGQAGENSPFATELIKILKNNTEALGIQQLSARLIDSVSRATNQKQTPVFQPIHVKGHELGQYVFHLKEDKETKLVKEIEASIEEGIAQIEVGQIRKAKRYFTGLLHEVKEDIQSEPYREKLINTIKEQLLICTNIPKYRPLIEKILQNKYATDLEKALQKLKEQEKILVDTKYQHEKIKKVLAHKEKETLTLKDQSLQQKTTIKEVEQLYWQANEELRKLKSELRQKERQIAQLNKKIKSLRVDSKLKTTLKKNDNNLRNKINNIHIEMVLVKGGTFDMKRKVTLSDYYMGKYPITQELWEAVMGNNPSHFQGNSNHPVENVSWEDAQQFITKLNQETGKNYRLPTEAEWEFAARGGNRSRNFKYSGSNQLKEVGWYKENSRKQLQVVGKKKANELGLYDISGNVWEWCHDWYGVYSEQPQTNPKGPYSGLDRILRGGSWNDSSMYCTVLYRRIGDPEDCRNIYGFRVAHS